MTAPGATSRTSDELRLASSTTVRHGDGGVPNRSERTLPLNTRTLLLDTTAPAMHAGMTEPFMMRAAVIVEPAPAYVEARDLAPAASCSMLAQPSGTRGRVIALAVAALLAIVGGVAVGVGLARPPAAPMSTIAVAAIEPAPAPVAIEVEESSPELDVTPTIAPRIAPEVTMPEPPALAPTPVVATTPAVVAEHPIPAKRSAKRRGSYAEVEWSLRKRAAARCKSGRNGFSVEVAFVIDPQGDTALVHPSGPNADSRSAKCVAKLVDAARFASADAGRQRLLVTL